MYINLYYIILYIPHLPPQKIWLSFWPSNPSPSQIDPRPWSALLRHSVLHVLPQWRKDVLQAVWTFLVPRKRSPKSTQLQSPICIWIYIYVLYVYITINYILYILYIHIWCNIYYIIFFLMKLAMFHCLSFRTNPYGGKMSTGHFIVDTRSNAQNSQC